MILDNIKKIDDIKFLSYEDLDLLAKETRDYMIETISKNGGHLASSLGVVELTLALIKTLNLPNDKIIWDVGHQSYAYKILTDRKDIFKTIRTYGGISGFPKRKESIYDSFDTGHSSTSISAGLGYVVSRDLDKKDNIIVSVIGDGALTGGESFEALQNLSKIKSNYIIILNDNEMSIAPSKGGMTHALSGVRTSRHYNFLKDVVKDFLKKIPNGENIKRGLSSLMNATKQLFVSDNGMFFENLDIIYLGPINGHNIKDLVDTIEKAKKLKRPVVIHIKTKKGKGYLPAENNPVTFHGVNPFDIKTGIVINNNNIETYTQVFSRKICELARNNKNILCISAAMPDGTGLKKFQDEFNNRFFDVGICEEHAVTFAAGIALSGKIPIVAIYSSFLQRAYDQIVEDVCMQNLHVVFMIDRAGLVGKDGETHHGVFDIVYLKHIPNITLMSPSDGKEFEKMIEFAINDCKGPVAIRYPRGEAYNRKNEIKDIVYGQSEIINEGKDIAVLAYGSMNKIANEIIKKYPNITLVNIRFAKPIDTKMIDKLMINHKIFIILEEGIENGGIGEQIKLYILSQKVNFEPKVYISGIEDRFISHGSVDELLKECALDSDSIINKYLKGGKIV